MFTVYGRATSTNTQIVCWALAELSLDFERLDYGGAYGGTRTPAYLAMQPMGLIPVLQGDGLTLFESAAILRYLAAQHGAGGLWPVDPAARARVDVWAEWGKNTFARALAQVIQSAVRTPPSRRDPALVAAARAEAARLAPMLDARLDPATGAGPWLMGAVFTYADIAAGHGLYRYYTLDIDRPETPHLDAYYHRLGDRPAFARHVMVDWEPLRAYD